MSESPRGRPAVSRDSRLSPRARGVDQLSQVTPAQVLGPAVDQLSRAPRGRARCTAGFTSCLGGLGPGSECPGCRPSVPRFGPGSQVPWGQPGVPGNSPSSPRARRVDQLSRASRARVRWSGGSTSFPRPLGRVSEVPRVRPALPGESRSALRAKGLTHGPGRHGPEPYGLRDRPAAPGDSRPVPRARGFDQISRANRARVCWPVVSTSCPA